jgi:hypothetical protein
MKTRTLLLLAAALTLQAVPTSHGAVRESTLLRSKHNRPAIFAPDIQNAPEHHHTAIVCPLLGLVAAQHSNVRRLRKRHHWTH